MTPDIFTHNVKGRICLHLETNTPCIVLKSQWFRGGLDYDVLVPQKDDKGNMIFAMQLIQKRK